jgi:hypothetical protein
MLKYVKRRRVDEEEGSENESKLSQPSASKAEKKATDKKNLAFTTSYLAMGFTWTGEENCPFPLCTVCGKTTKYGYGPGKV